VSSCEIEWNTLSLAQWESRFAKIVRPNLLQSYEYGIAVARLNHQKPRWGLIKINAQDAGLVQIFETGLFGNLIHTVIIDRGPLWFNGFGTEDHFEAFCQALNTEFPPRFGRKRRFIPEIENSKNTQEILENAQFVRKYEHNYETLCINLTNSEQKILKNTKKNWRNALNKAKKSNLSVKWDEKGEYLGWFLQNYIQDRQQKNYDGPSPKLIHALAKTFIPRKNFLIGQALTDNKPIAAILILCHGAGATYQIGWSSNAGRKNNAHHLLLWEAITMLKQKGIKDFDLGGINDDRAKGVKKFKEGMGGHTLSLPGIYH